MKNQNRFRNSNQIGVLDDFRFRIVILAFIMLILLSILLFRAYFLQLHHGEEHRAEIERQSIRSIRIPGRRGSIYSADGKILAGNRTVYDLVFYPEAMRSGGGPRRTLETMCQSAGKISAIIGRTDFPDRRAIARHLNISPGMPLTVFSDLSARECALIMEAARDMKGMDIQISIRRIYPYGKMAAHIIGYSRKAEAATADDRKEFSYYQPDTEGRAGIELVYDEIPGLKKNSAGLGLRAYPGSLSVRVNNIGFVHRERLGKREPVHGNDVHLTIDSRAQMIAENLLQNKSGSLIVMDADSGDIICAATSPSYDLKKFSPRLSPEYYRSLLNDAARPLINRACSGIYPPGSTLKPLICLALLKGGIDPKETVFCSGRIEILNTPIRCLAHRYTEADVDMQLALEKSCNTYMIVQSLKAGFPVLEAMLKTAGIGQKTGIEIHESAGNFPSAERKKKLYRIPWNDTDTALLSIGQGFISMTPLQMVRYTAAICNGGKLYRPHLVRKVSDVSNEAVFNREIICDGDLGVSPEHLEIVRQGMFRVVNSPGGSGRRAKSDGLVIYGKTGTAETGPRNNRKNMIHFIAFTTFKQRKYALAVTVEHGDAGGLTCAPMAKEFFERFLLRQTEETQP